jgi:hypothetical protein
VPGETTAFHVRLVDGQWWPVVDWGIDDEIGECEMTDDGDVRLLATAVNAGKAALGAAPGGSFLIDEHGRVLVPAHEGGHATVVVAAECSGPLRFHDPFSGGAVFDLYDDRDLHCGDDWDRPYLGLRHNLSARGWMYFWEEDSAGGRMVYPPSQDDSFISALRELRPYGAVRFLVGPAGVAITKVPPTWKPCYVGRVDLATWFPKEALA